MIRLSHGGSRIDRRRSIGFRWNGEPLTALAGDTLASALLVNGRRTVSYSVSLGRARGIFSAGVEEPNAYVQVTVGGAVQQMVQATLVEVVDGLQAVSLNGKGRLTSNAARDRHDKVYAHCDVLVVGAGAAGVNEALAAGRRGARVLLVDDQPVPGGTPAQVAELAALTETRVLTRATAVGYYEANCVVIVEDRPGGQRLWQVRAGEVILATGAVERSLVFANNDRPGIMLAGAIGTYLQRFAVLVGERLVLFTNNDRAYPLAVDLLAAGASIAALVDTRAQPGSVADSLRASGVAVLAGYAVVDTAGDPTLSAVHVQQLDADRVPCGPIEAVACDVLGVTGGFNPALNLFSQSGGRTRFDVDRGYFVPAGASQLVRVVGSAAGHFDPPLAVDPSWLIAAPNCDWTRHFVDLERDTTVADLQRGIGAGLQAIEHLKRYTTFGTGSDQGKTSSVVTAGVVAALQGAAAATLGTTSARPPYMPVSFELLAGTSSGALYDPVRVTAIHPWHVARGAVFENVGQWKRPWYYPRAGEDMPAAVSRECRAARERVGVIDASTLGKIELQGPDAAEFLNRLYTNAFDNLAVGSIRYGLMCRADGMIFDDGVVMRLAADRFLTTTTTGNAAAVLEWMEEWLQTEWPTLRVRLTSVTDHWATVAVVGPRARDVLRALTTDIAVDASSFPFMQWREGTVAGAPARVCRVTYSGELAFEIHTPAWYGLAVWQAVMEAGHAYDITPYGTEAMHVLRAEKGYIIVGQDTDGTVTPIDAGLGWLVSRRKPDFIGRRSLDRADTRRADRKHLIGLLPVDPNELLVEGAPLVLDPDHSGAGVTGGHVTSSYDSAALGRTFALALLVSGRERIGTSVYVARPERMIEVRVVEPVFYDPQNQRRDG